jgi:P pilus assembly chaperone PapD
MIKTMLRSSLLGAALLLAPQVASAEIVLSQLVVDIAPGKAARGDIEVWNNDKERAYVVVEPSEVLQPGTPAERRVAERNPEKLGLLVTPARMILEPGQRKLLRISPIGGFPQRERVYRVTVKPTVGSVETNVTGLKLLIGYDVLVLLRPGGAPGHLTGRRDGNQLVIRNDGGTSVELSAGKACKGKTDCRELPAKRLYAGAEWRVDVPAGATVEYAVVSPTGTGRQTF